MSKKYKLHFDEGTSERAEQRKKAEAQKLNNALPVILAFFDEGLTDDELRSLKSYKDIVDRFKADFPFPNATEETNFNLLGKDTTGLKEASHALKLLNDDYILTDGKVEISPSWFDTNIEKHTRRTQTEGEEKAFEYATKLAKLMGEGFNQGFISEHIRAKTFHELNLFYLEKDGSHKIRPRGIWEAGERYDKASKTE